MKTRSTADDELVIDGNKSAQRMPQDVDPYAVDHCAAMYGCPRAVGDVARAAAYVRSNLERNDAAAVVMSKTRGPLRPHGRLAVSISGCANSCSRPQIADFGLVAREEPVVVEEDCTQCGLCEEACREGSVRVDAAGPHIDRSRCLECGECVRACPTGGLQAGRTGWKVLAGGHLGRHPRLAEELAPRATLEEAGAFLTGLLEVWRNEGAADERIGTMLDRLGAEHRAGTAELLVENRAGNGKEQ